MRPRYYHAINTFKVEETLTTVRPMTLISFIIHILYNIIVDGRVNSQSLHRIIKAFQIYFNDMFVHISSSEKISLRNYYQVS